MYDARQIANWFIRRAAQDERVLSIMSLLKLIYISHGWHLESQKSPLFSNRIEAWQYGPVIPDVYRDFRKQGISVASPLNIPEAELEESDEKLLEEIYEIYGKMPPFRLSHLTHVPGGPWDIMVKTGGHFTEIPDDLIKQHYQLKRANASG